jgi:uncharacterized protein YgiM (DUF1202 family)
VPTKTPEIIARTKLDRRTIMKATAAFVAAAATTQAPRRKVAAQATPTRAAEWIQPDSIGGDQGSLGFQSEFPFYALAPHWPGETDFSASVQVQTSKDGVSWSDPVILGPAHTDAGPADRDNRVYGQLAFTDESNHVRYQTLDADGTPRGLSGLQFTYIDATGGPGLDDISTDSPVPSLQRPPIISREEWGANLTYGGAERGASDWIPEYVDVEHVIIHHAETSNFRDPLSEIRSIHYYHAITRGWGDIGYNYLVDFMGNVYEGRVGGDNVVGGHAYQYAYGSSGICAMGSFTLATATPEMLAGLIWITAWTGRYLDPLGRADFHEKPNLPTICGHRDVNDSTCPGDGLYADLGYLREAVADVLAGARETIPNPEYSPGQVVETTVEGANLRTKPGTSASIAREVPFGSVFQVIEGPTTVDDNVWYHVDGDVGSGWLATSTFGASDAAAPTGQFAHGDVVLTSTDMINIRDTPSLKGLIVATLPFMTEATVVDGPMPANGYKWYQVETAHGTGWSTEQYLAFEDDIEIPVRFAIGDPVKVADPEGVRLRSNPSADASSIASLSPGETGTVVDGPATADAMAWVKVQTTKGTGWMAEQYLDSAPYAAPPKSRFKAGDTIVVDTDSVNLREEPGSTEEVITTLGTGLTGTVVEVGEIVNNLLWLRLESEYGTGWAAENFFAPADSASTSHAFEAGAAIYVNTDAINVRQSPSLSAEPITVLVTNETGTIAEGPKVADGQTWYKIDTASGSGWAAAQYLSKGTPDPATSGGIRVGDQIRMNTDALNMREEPSVSAKWLAALYVGETATVTDGPREADGHTWYKIVAPSGEGWAVRSYMERVDDAPLGSGDTARVYDGELNLREAGSTGADVIAVLPDATYVDVLEGPVDADGYLWYRVSSSRFGTGWCAAEWLARL